MAIKVSLKRMSLAALCLIIALASGCAPAPQAAKPTQPAQPTQAAQAEPTQPPTEAPTAEPTTAPQPTATLAPTLAPSPTLAATAAPTVMPVAETAPAADVQYNQPGIYNAGGCITYKLLRSDQVLFCVDHVEVYENGDIAVVTSWTTNLTSNILYTKRKDRGNRNMYLVDNLGNRYDHYNVGGTADQDVKMQNGVTVLGWFIFPAPQPGATSFTFFDDDQLVSISKFTLKDPIIVSQKLALKASPFELEYLIANWTPGETEAGAPVLESLDVPGCELVEWAPAEPEGKLKSTVSIGAATFEIYGLPEPDGSRGVREYLAISGLDGLEGAPVMFRAYIPYDASQLCLSGLSSLLSTLSPVKK